MSLGLSPSQQRRFAAWKRPGEFCIEPVMIMAISPQAVTQNCVTNCSFVCSLAVAANYERRFKRPLVTSIIYPQRRDGMPVVNPYGKYMVRLNFNGIPRKVIIDDRLPVDSRGELLTTYSSNNREMWMPIIEKAFLKVMGESYDFPGSNSHVDLYTLTGYIP